MFELSNPSLIPLEVSVSARFGYTEATENGREVVVEDTLDSRLGDLSEVVDIHPGVLVLDAWREGADPVRGEGRSACGYGGEGVRCILRRGVRASSVRSFGSNARGRFPVIGQPV